MTRFKLLSLLSSALLLTSCNTLQPRPQPTTHSAATETPDILAKGCVAIFPIYYSRHDTPQTQHQVQKLNAGVVQLCPQYLPAKTKK